MQVITPLDMYMLTRLDAIKGPLELLSVLGIIVGFVGVGTAILYRLIEERDPPRVLWRASVGTLVASAIGLLLNVALPTTKEMVVIKVIPAIVNNETLQKDMKDLNSQGMDMVTTTCDWLKAKMAKDIAGAKVDTKSKE